MHDSDPDAWFIFNLQREPFCIMHTQHKVKSGCELLKRKKESSLTWKGGPVFMVANFHPLSSIALSQLPLRPLPFPHPPHLLLAKKDVYLHTNDIKMPAASVRHN
jgi:hypothetical protein